MNTKISQEKILEKISKPKICSKCKELKTYDELVKRTKYKESDIYSTMSYCKKCFNKKNEERRKRNPSEKRKTSTKIRAKRSRLLREYGVDMNWYYDTILLQDFKCKICNIKIDENTGVIDHCHSTLKVRGVLCRICNSGLGMFKDNIENLKNAIKYLET